MIPIEERTYPTIEEQERGYLVGLQVKGDPGPLPVKDSLEELALLARTAGINVIGATYQNVTKINPATYIGKGKTEEIHEDIHAMDIDVVIFDDELSPRHQRELEEIFGENMKVLDRSALILDIFAQHARTREGALQVELAQYEYRLPRLTRAWTHLVRQAGGGGGRSGNGGVGLRGPGETQLEMDQRDIRRRISHLKEELEQVRAHRGRYRAQREKSGIPVVSLVGYTNAGKSTLLNAITGADVYAANQLFATLDPTTRRVELPGGKTFLITDTVGFIQKLPPTLVAAFRATLEEIAEADILLHVVDSNHPNVRQQIDTVEETLADLDVPDMPRILVLNKIDLWEPGTEVPIEKWGRGYDEVMTISALEGTGIDELLESIGDLVLDEMVKVNVEIPYQRGDITASLYENGIVESEEHTSSGVRMIVHVPPVLAEQIKDYWLENDEEEGNNVPI
jgi:GTP-binding protein HflX